jgi:hypothetical protein
MEGQQRRLPLRALRVVVSPVTGQPIPSKVAIRFWRLSKLEHLAVPMASRFSRLSAVNRSCTGLQPLTDSWCRLCNHLACSDGALLFGGWRWDAGWVRSGR